jgi:predicted Rdx family selenoprotein
LAAAIKSATDVESELVAGGGGIFDVVVDGNRIYCKHETGQFPSDEEILDSIQSN